MPDFDDFHAFTSTSGSDGSGSGGSGCSLGCFSWIIIIYVVFWIISRLFY